MKKSLIFTVFFIILFAIFCFLAPAFAQENISPTPAPAVNAPLVINEIAAFEEAGFEWIEVLNISELALDITNFSFYEDDTKHKLKAVKNDLILEPLEFAVIAQDALKFSQKYPAAATVIDSSWGSLKEDGEEIGLVNAAGNFLEKFIYIAAQKTSLERKDPKLLDYTGQNWLPNPISATPGEKNNAAPEINPPPVQENPVENPVAENPPAENPVIENPIIENPASEDPSENPAVENPVTENPASEEPSENPAEENPITENPPADPPTDQPADPQTDPPADPPVDPPADPPSPSQEQPNPENSEPLPPTPLRIYINEVSFRDTDFDWIELFIKEAPENTADLNGWTIWSDKLLFTIPADTKINAGNYYTVSLENTDGLPATTEHLLLKNPQEKAIDAVCWTNGSVAEHEIADIKNLAENEMWISEEPSSCVDTAKLQKDQTIGRGLVFQDTDSKDDWQIFKHDSKNAANEYKNQNPTAVITVQKGQIAGEVPLTINVSGESSFDPDNDALRFLWNFGDGTFEESPNPRSHTYTASGNFQLTLTVEDSFEGSGAASLPIQVLAKIPPPEIVIVPQILRSAALVASENPPPQSAKKTTKTKKPAVKKTTAKKTDVKNTAPKKTTVKKPVPKKPAAKKTTSKAVKKPVSKKISEELYKNGDLSKSLRITEILPNPEGSDSEEEWVEIYNSENRKIRLGNWILDDAEGGSKPFVFPDSKIIEAKSYLVLQREETKLAFNNSGDSVRLFNFLKKPVHEISYPSAPSGKSYADFNGNFEWTEDLTPGAQNPHYRLIAGQIEEVNPVLKSVLIAGASGFENVSFDENILHPLVAPLALPKGSQVTLQVKEENEGNFSLRKIDSVVLPEKPEGNYFPWIIGATVALSVLANLCFLLFSFWPKIKEYLKH